MLRGDCKKNEQKAQFPYFLDVSVDKAFYLLSLLKDIKKALFNPRRLYGSLLCLRYFIPAGVIHEAYYNPPLI